MATSGFLRELEEWPPLVGSLRLSLKVWPSFRPPWRFFVEEHEHNASWQLLRWSIRSRAETGGTDFGLFSRLAQLAPVSESGFTSGRLVTPPLEPLGDAREDGLLDGWTAWARVESQAGSSQFQVRLSAAPRSPSWSAYRPQLEFLRALVTVAREVSRSFAGQWALDSLDDLAPAPPVHLLNDASPRAVRLTNWSEAAEGELAALLPTSEPAVLEVLPLVYRRGVPPGLEALVRARPGVQLAVCGPSALERLTRAAPGFAARAVADADLAWAALARR
jgi:hypothetical protein